MAAPSSLIVALAGTAGMVAGSLADGWSVGGSHAQHDAGALHGALALHGGLYAWLFMLTACWLAGWITMGQSHTRAACLATSMLIMIALTTTLAWTQATPTSTGLAHLVMLLTMGVSHEAGVRIVRHLAPHSSLR